MFSDHNTSQRDDNSVDFFTVKDSIVNEINILCNCHGEYCEEPQLGTFFNLTREQSKIAEFTGNQGIVELVNKTKRSVIEKNSDHIHIPIIHHSPYLDDNRYLYYFLSNTIATKQGSGKSLGGIYVLVDKNKLDIPTSKKDCHEFFDLWERLTEKLAVRIIHYYDHEQKKNHALKAAISQVMARNMSHNIGSHVMSKYNSVIDIANPLGIKKQYNFDVPRNKTKSEYAAIFNNYLKVRMEFLADIATADPVIENTIDFESRLMAGIEENVILLDRISGLSEKIDCNDSAFQYVFVNKYNGNEINNGPRIYLSIPNDILGAHAFYIIIENIIRNIAKHGEVIRGKEVKISIDINDQYDGPYYIISIYDNITKNEESIKDLVNLRNNKICDDCIDSGVLRSNSLGTIEMLVCATYLRCLPLVSVNKSEYKYEDQSVNKLVLPILHAYAHKDTSDQYSLGYKIYINKPKEILVLDETGKFSINGISKEQLINKGILVVEKIDNNLVYNYQILYVIVDNESDIPLTYTGQTRLPKRVVYSSEYSFCTVDDCINIIWGKYVDSHIHWLKMFTFIYDGIIANCLDKDNKEIVKVFIDNHGKNWDKAESFDYYEINRSMQKINDYLININQLKKYEYIEILNTRIVIIDERIQDTLVNKKTMYQNILLKEFFEKQYIYIPDEYVCLNNSDFGKIIEEGSVSNNIKKYICEIKSNNIDFFVIHLGVLEKMKGSDLNQTINILFKDCREKVVVISGRGNANNLPKDILYIPVSLVQNAMEVLHDKILLTKILYNSRTQD